MFKFKEKVSNPMLRKVIIAFSIIIALIIIILLYNLLFTHQVYLGVHVNQKHLGAKSYSDVFNFLETESQKLNENGLDYVHQDMTVNIDPLITTLDDPDLSYQLIEFNNQETAEHVFKVGREKDLWNNTLEQLKILFIPKHLDWEYNFNQEEWRGILKNNFKEFETSFIPPTISFENEEIMILESVDGEEFDYDLLITQTEERINNFSSEAINLELKSIKSDISLIEAQEKIDLIKDIIALDSLTLNYDQRFWKINVALYRDWLVLKTNNEGEVIISFDFDKYQEHLETYIIPSINRDSRDAKFDIQNGRVIKFQSSRDGQTVNVEQSLEVIENEINNLNSEIDLAVDVVKADIETQNVNDKGIREIIGVGESDFRKSPVNRLHNIEAGADKLNGLLIAPGEEFATMGNLTPITAESGYLPELVIKGNKTIPEYGGGLCQIGTTIYRAALESGLQITQRRPHSYRVVYYEPAGTDATIYDPWPDMKFINDTDNHILIQTSIVGSKLYFEFWGTKDGRQVTLTDPVIYNITDPGPTKEIETTELEPGEKDCTESAHAGADAYFDYTVDYSDDRETYEERVTSHYIPWPAVCLIGVEKTTTSTEEVIEEE
jgi:vancomycin resistance protein YoaR